jgi:hypothetical protein
MMSSNESPAFNSRPVPNRSPNVRYATLARKLGAYTAVVVAKLRELAPYAAMELVLPGGSLMALLLWLYRRQKIGSCPSRVSR